MSKTFKHVDTFEIEGRALGDGQPIFIIAEIGVNHNGDLKLAKECVSSAATCGVDAVKFQTFRTEEFMADRELTYSYESAGMMVREKMYDMFKRLELPAEWHEELFTHARDVGVIPLTSVADTVSADMVRSIGAGALKLSSEDFINLPLVKHVAQSGLPLILSTGMADEEEIGDVIEILERADCRQVCFLHCVSVYPTPENEAHLRRLQALKELVGATVGYSDHTIGIDACLGSVALGAKIIEKHFTVDRSLSGPDHAISSDPEEMQKLVTSVRRVERMLGANDLRPSLAEHESRCQFRRSIVAAKDLARGNVLANVDLVLRRPGTGLRARDMHKLVGKTLLQDVSANEVIKTDMVDKA